MASDPRTEAAAKAEFEEDNDHCPPGWDEASPALQESYIRSVRHGLAAADAADRDRGVVRVDTRDEATVERLALAFHDRGCQGPETCIVRPNSTDREHARAALAALAQEDNR